MAVTQQRGPPTRARITLTAVDAVVLAAVAVALAFPIVARLAADELPIAPAPVVSLPALAPDARAGTVRDVPVGLIRGSPPRSIRHVAPVAAGLLGADRARLLLDEMRTAPEDTSETYRYPGLERLVPRDLPAAQATDLGARMMVLAGADVPGAGPAAYVLLTRPADGAGCDAKVNLLLLLAADPNAAPPVVARQAANAVQACPGDPTPGWLYGQFVSQLDQQYVRTCTRNDKTNVCIIYDKYYDSNYIT